MVKRNVQKAAAARHATVDASESGRCWLMKAEPDSREEKGQDIAFSVDKFASMPDQTSCWDGVRNAVASKYMREGMKEGDRVLFYHSNCKLPGIAGLARVVREGYPDHTAWDSSHPYYDAKTDRAKPRWYMVDVQLTEKLAHFVPLALLQYLVASDCTHSLPYLTTADVETISAMQLLSRGRLSVQQVDAQAYEAICQLGRKGGWQDWPGKWAPKRKAESRAAETNNAGESKAVPVADLDEPTPRRGKRQKKAAV